MNAIEFSTMLREWRARCGFSDAEAAAALGCRYGTIRHWLAGRTVPAYFTLCAVVRQIREGCDPVLNEGIDVPEASVAIVAGGSLGQREHVQRIGRVLRPQPKKQTLVHELVTLDTVDEARDRARKRPHAAPASALSHPA